MRAYSYGAVWLLAAVALAYTAGFMVKNGDPGALGWWQLALGFFAWASALYLLAGWYAYRRRHSPSAVIAVFVATLLMAAGGFGLLWDAFVTHVDPQSGLVFVVLPPVQFVVAGLGIGVAAVIKEPPPDDHPRSG